MEIELFGDGTTFAERLKEAMQVSGMKQVDLVNAAAAHGVKLGKSYVSQYVTGKTIPRADILNFLAETLSVDVGWLRDGSAAPQTANPPAELTDELATDSATADCAERDVLESASPAPDLSDLPEPRTTTPSHARPTKEGTPMRQFNKSSKLDHVLYDVRGPVVDEANRMEQAGTHVLKLNIGNPAPFGFRTPDEVVQDMSRQLVDCEGYSNSHGLFSARKAIM